MRPEREGFVPRADLGFPDRRKKLRPERYFADEAEAERRDGDGRGNDVTAEGKRGGCA